MEDNSIIELFLQRNEMAITEVSRKYNDFCFGIAWNILSNREDAEECVNDTWFTTWRNIPPTRPKFLVAFLGKITRNSAIDCFRKKSAGKRMDTHMKDIEGELERLDNILPYTNPSYNIDEYLEKIALLEIINSFLDGLSAEERDIFVRRYWYMDPIKNIAGRHGVPSSNIKTKLFRLRNKLLKILEKEDIDGRFV